MRILLIRHGDPDYQNDTVTEKGAREVKLLTARLKKENIDKIYCSPLGRAYATAAPLAANAGKEITVLDWLAEIDIKYNIEGKTVSPWDIPPHIWPQNPKLLDKEGWASWSLYENETLAKKVQEVQAAFDALIEKHGFRHTGQCFEILPGYAHSTETIALFCHMGLGNVLLSHLFGIAAPIWWHKMFLPPTSVTTVYMERHSTDASLALPHFIGIGDVSHLYAGGEPISASGLKNCRRTVFPPESL